ncbi:CoA transferase [Mycobacterium sp. 94-17]|uniref:CaiB/BaiF CoA transferase family protein n=1 Tax=Mycobacterium sp. 94-17 TaxID=2986147 RepID=UPI002D1E6B4E|nr:CoA transferase [Mycobacterium sp. 94-17]MEB4209773.1 CoA transferase [Mycobacterium sp. 94-17]
MGVLDSVTVLDLSTGITGPMAAMLLADHGAAVTRIESPHPDALADFSGYRVWNRGKRSAVLDLTGDTDRQRLHALVRTADVLIESYGPGTAEKLGVDYASLRVINPRLIYSSITPYGEEGPDTQRPGYDALVAARTGLQWEVRGTVGSTMGRLAGTDGMLPGIELPDGQWVGPDRDGPLFTGVPWPSIGAAYVAIVAINVAIRARGLTGRGQRVDTSLLHGVLVGTLGGWAKVERPDTPMFATWVGDPRAPKGFFRTSDNRWTHHWVPLPGFVLAAAESGMQLTSDLVPPKDSDLRISPMAEDMVLLHMYDPLMAEAVAKHTAQQWTDLAAQVGVPVQTVRSPEEALLDPLLLADGCVVDVEDPQVGVIRQVGRVVELQRHPFTTPTGAPVRGADTDAVRAEADALIAAGTSAVETASDGAPLQAPLDGVTVIDLGLAVAGPWGTQLLAQLGARVIKVNTMYDEWWFSNHIAMSCNRDKESIALDLKAPEAKEILLKLVERADIVQHNMRSDAAIRLGVDYESLRQINPRLIYCHTLGHEQGPRQQHPGNDQTGAALAGTTWLDGGMDNGGRPHWSCTSMGDTGNGFLSALGMIQALYDRDRTGEGQLVRTSILYAQLLNASTSWISPDGGLAADRPCVDAELYGWSALYRLYPTAGGWLCLAAVTEPQFAALATAIGHTELATDPLFATTQARREHDAELASLLAAVFADGSAHDWFERLNAAGVPVEISDPDWVLRTFADRAAERRQTTATFQHRTVGQMTVSGLIFQLSDTPGVLKRGPIWPGEDSRAILLELGYLSDEVDKLVEAGIVGDTALT